MKWTFGEDVEYLIRAYFRKDKISRLFAQNHDLREIARKLVQNFWSFVPGAQKLIRAKIFSRNFVPRIVFVPSALWRMILALSGSILSHVSLSYPRHSDVSL